MDSRSTQNHRSKKSGGPNVGINPLVSLARGLWLICHRRIRAHAIHMQALYLQALLGAGVFTFLPGRMMSRVLLTKPQHWGLVALCFFWRGILVLAAPDTAFRAVLEKALKGFSRGAVHRAARHDCRLRQLPQRVLPRQSLRPRPRRR